MNKSACMNHWSLINPGSRDFCFLLVNFANNLDPEHVVLVFNVPPTAKVIWRQGHSLKSHPTDWRSRESNLRPLVYKASSLSTTPQRLLDPEQAGHFVLNLLMAFQKENSEKCNFEKNIHMWSWLSTHHRTLQTLYSASVVLTLWLVL